MRYWTLFLRIIGEFVPVVLLCVVTTIITADVVARTVFSRPVFAASEIALISFVWLVWLGAAGVARTDELMGITYFRDRLGRFKQAAMVFSDLLIVAMIGFCIYATYRQIITARFTVFDSLALPKWILAVGVEVSFVLLFIVYFARLIGHVRGKVRTSEIPANQP